MFKRTVFEQRKMSNLGLFNDKNDNVKTAFSEKGIMVDVMRHERVYIAYIIANARTVDGCVYKGVIEQTMVVRIHFLRYSPVRY